MQQRDDLKGLLPNNTIHSNIVARYVVPPGVTAVRVEGEEQPCRAWRRSDI
jgi:hypothetical protein